MKRHGATWLDKEITKMDEAKKLSNQRTLGDIELKLPRDRNGATYPLTMAKEDQREILCCVLAKLKEWLDYTLKPMENQHKFPQVE